jgi:exosortase
VSSILPDTTKRVPPIENLLSSAVVNNSAATSMPFVRRVSLRAAGIVVFFAALWGILWWHLSGEWSVNDQYSYGWFVPLFAIVLFWLRWEDRPRAGKLGTRNSEFGEQRTENSDQITSNEEPITNNAKARTIAIGIAIVALLLLFPIRLFEIGNPDWRPLSWLHALCAVAITLAFLWSAGGTPWLRHFAFPVVFTLVAVPWVSPIEQPIVQGLMRIVAAISTETVAIFGIPARLEGHLIRIPDGLVGVNEACSGVRSLQTSLMIGLLFGELKRLSILRRVVLVIAAAAIAFLGNCIRAFFLVWVAATKDITAANRWHDFAGYGIVFLVFVGSLILAAILGRHQKTEVRGQRTHVQEQFRMSNVEFRILAAVVVWLIAVEVAAAGWYRAHERGLAEATRWEVQWPQTAPNFREIKIDDDMRRILRFDQAHAASWSLPATNSTDGSSAAGKPSNCTLYFFRWDSGKNSALLANLHRPDVCLPAIGWNQTGDVGVKKYPVTPNLSLPFRHFEFRHGTSDQPTQQTAHAFYCLWEDRVTSTRTESQLPEMTSSPSAWTRNERVRAVLEGRRHLGQQVMELIIQTRGVTDESEVNARFESELPGLIKIEAGN